VQREIAAVAPDELPVVDRENAVGEAHLRFDGRKRLPRGHDGAAVHSCVDGGLRQRSRDVPIEGDQTSRGFAEAEPPCPRFDRDLIAAERGVDGVAVEVDLRGRGRGGWARHRVPFVDRQLVGVNRGACVQRQLRLVRPAQRGLHRDGGLCRAERPGEDRLAAQLARPVVKLGVEVEVREAEGVVQHGRGRSREGELAVERPVREVTRGAARAHRAVQAKRAVRFRVHRDGPGPVGERGVDRAIEPEVLAAREARRSRTPRRSRTATERGGVPAVPAPVEPPAHQRSRCDPYRALAKGQQRAPRAAGV